MQTFCAGQCQKQMQFRGHRLRLAGYGKKVGNKHKGKKFLTGHKRNGCLFCIATHLTMQRLPLVHREEMEGFFGPIFLNVYTNNLLFLAKAFCKFIITLCLVEVYMLQIHFTPENGLW